jgi:hypothetical protein
MKEETNGTSKVFVDECMDWGGTFEVIKDKRIDRWRVISCKV